MKRLPKKAPSSPGLFVLATRSSSFAKFAAIRCALEAPPGPTTDREIVCLSCGDPLRGREGAFLSNTSWFRD